MKLTGTQIDPEHHEIELLIEEFNSIGGMSTEELITRLDAVPFDKFQRELKKKIHNY